MKRFEKKGVSPVIATVLLITLVIVIAFIIFAFMKNLGGEVLTKFSGENIKLTCQKVDFNVDYIDGRIVISNLGEVPIYDMSLKLIKEGSHETISVKEISGTDPESGESYWPSSGLSQGNVASVPVTTELEGVSTIVASPVLIGKTKQGEKKSYPCEEGSFQGESEILI